MIVKSPDKSNSITLELNENRTLFYSVRSNGTDAVEKSLMGIDIADSLLDFNSDLTLEKIQRSVVDETYTLPTGKTSVYINKANESVFIFKNRYDKILKVICRAYNDGIAFRYVIDNSAGVTVRKKFTRFQIPKNTMSWIMDYVPNYENIYQERLLDTISAKPLSFPALMHIDDNLWMLLTEASVYNQPGCHLTKTGIGNEMKIELPEEEYTVESVWESPWRTFIMGTKLGTIVESVMVENLNPPSVISDMSWIKPGVAVFPWRGNWMANSYPDTLKMYVDMASEMNWKWIEFDVSLVGSPFRTSELWETTEWLPDFTAYSKSNNISVYGWDEINILKTQEGRDKIYSRYLDLGIKGIKIDYIDSDKQYAMVFRNSAMEDAAKRKLMVSFHGETLPRGQRRTYPNVMTLEAVLGAEYYTFKGTHSPSPEHNCTLPFTRNVVGSMDYTPVTFTIRPEVKRTTTYTHELALSVIVESGWLVMADRPEAYLNSPAKNFLKKLESAWDETRFIDGFPGDYICLARRKGENWYIAGINSGAERKIDIPLDFIR
ncbi:MAG TPA: glycoside hydrolase family 97 catalytic domain-containing protein, partial [Bacteroidales bacterium]|nr:glycoside hydrolase family 97 catalytic domain-containing protein [Bacteroidales bacterium]